MRSRSHAASPQANSQLPAKKKKKKKKKGIFGSVGICLRRFACRESCYVNRQVSRILEICVSTISKTNVSDSGPRTAAR